MSWSDFSAILLPVLLINGVTGALLYGLWRLVLRLIPQKMDIQITYILLRLITLYFLIPAFGIWQLGIWLTNGYWGQLAALIGEGPKLACSVIAGIWLAGTLILLIRDTVRHVQIVRLTRLGSMPARVQWIRSAEAVQQMLRLRRRVAVRERYGDTSVFVTGVRRPVIYLPEGLFTEDERTAILLHEMTHIQEKDLVWKMAADLVKCIYWPLGIPRLMANDIHDWSEFNCDYLSCAVLGSAKDYFLLVERMIAENQRWYRSPWLATMGQDRNELIRRMKKMINQQKLSPVRRMWIFIVAAVFLIGGSTVVMAGTVSAMLEYRESYWDNLDVVYEEGELNLWKDRILPSGWEKTVNTSILEPEEWEIVSPESFWQTDGLSTFFEWDLPAGSTFLSEPFTAQSGREIVLGCGPENTGDTVLIGMLFPDGVCHYSVIDSDGTQIYPLTQTGEYRLIAIHRSEGKLRVGGYYMVR